MIALSDSNRTELEALIFEQEQVDNGNGIQESYPGNTRSNENKQSIYNAFLETFAEEELLTFQVLDDQYMMARYMNSEGKLLSEIYEYKILDLESTKINFTLLHKREEALTEEQDGNQLALSSSIMPIEYDVLRTTVKYDIENNQVAAYRPQSLFRYYLSESPDKKWGILVKSKAGYYFEADTYLVNLETDEEIMISSNSDYYYLNSGSNWKPDSTKILLSGQFILDTQTAVLSEMQLDFQPEELLSVFAREEGIWMLTRKGDQAPFEYEWNIYNWEGIWLESKPILGIESDELFVMQGSPLDEKEGIFLLQTETYSDTKGYRSMTYLISANGEIKALENDVQINVQILPIPNMELFFAYTYDEDSLIELYNDKGEVVLGSESIEEQFWSDFSRYQLLGVDREKKWLYFGEPWGVYESIEEGDLDEWRTEYRTDLSMKVLMLDTMKVFDLELKNITFPLFQWGYVVLNGFDGKFLELDVYQEKIPE